MVRTSFEKHVEVRESFYASTSIESIGREVRMSRFSLGRSGIGNVMLLSVTERTREIGVRLAVGARARDVGSQFFLEALLLGAVGGVAGVVLGVALSRIVSESFGWTTSLSPGVVVVSYGIAIAIGLVAGFFPARRAARLDPIEALRYE